MKRIRRRSDLPRHRTSEAREQRRLQEGLAELEFRADLDPNMDPVSALGYEPGKAKAEFEQVFDEGGELAGVYNPPNARQGEGESLPNMDIVQGQTRNDIRIGDVMVARDFLDDKETWAHEFRHRGLNDLRTRFSREEFAEKYGEETAEFLYTADDEEDFVRFAGTPIEGADNSVGANMDERGPKLIAALNDAALDAMEDDRLSPEDRKQASGWLRRFLNKGTQ